MEATTIFDILLESRLLEKIRKKSNIIFVGDRDTINYLKIYFNESNNSFKYFYFDEEGKDALSQNYFINELNQLLSCKATIVASVKNEHDIYEHLKIFFTQNFIKVPLVRLFSDIYVNIMSGQELLQNADCEFQVPNVSYAIVTTPRSGSTFLCNILKSTEIVGIPLEHLRRPSQFLSQHCHFNYIRYLTILMNYNITSNKVFGTKFISHFLKGHIKASPEFKKIFDTYISKFIYLVRRDRIAQAVSLFLAKKTKIWHIPNQNIYDLYINKINQLNFQDSDLEEVHKLHLFLLEEEAFLRKLFKDNKIEPLLIEYESLVQYPQIYLKNILDFLSIETYQEINFETNAIKKTSSDLSKSIVERYSKKYLN